MIQNLALIYTIEIPQPCREGHVIVRSAKIAPTALSHFPSRTEKRSVSEVFSGLLGLRQYGVPPQSPSGIRSHHLLL